MNSEAIKLIEDKLRFVVGMLDITTDFEESIYKEWVREKRLYEYILKILKKEDVSNE